MNNPTHYLRAGVVLLTLSASAVQAQQVQVFSDGKPVASLDAANATRGRVKDERKARRPLSELPEGSKIAAAHADAFLRCGLDETAYPPVKPFSPEERDYFVKNAAYIPIAGTRKIILIGEYMRGKAVVDLDKLAPLTPQCPAGVRSMFWSHGSERIAFATLEVTRIDFHGDRSMWTGKFKEAQDIWYLDHAEAAPKLRKVMSLPGERVLDVLLPDRADHLWVLSYSEKIDLRNPRKWMRALSGSPAKKADIYLRKVDLQGKTLETVTMAKAVAAGTAHFVRE